MEKLFMQQSKDDIAFQTMNAHEHLIQMLSSVQVQLHSLQALLRNDEAQTDVAAIRNGLNAAEQLTQEAIYEIRSVNDDDLLPNLYGDTLMEALSRAVEETAELLGLSSRITFSGEERPLPSYTERLIYRIAQEALDQIRQHSNARKLRFTFSFGREEIQMSLEDDGIVSIVDADEEFPIPHFQNDKAGASSIEEVPLPHFRAEELFSPYNTLHHRLEHLGGSLEVTSQIEHGTRVQVRVPYSNPNSNPYAGVVSNGSAPNVVNHAEKAPPKIKVRLLIVDDQAVSRAGLRRLLESYPDLQVVGEAADGLQAVSETLELGPQVVLMDANLPNGQSIEALKQIKQLNLDTRVLLFAAQDREEYLYETLRAGADGYVLKDIVPDDLAQAVRVVASGEVLVQAQLAGRLLSRFGKQGRGSAPYETLTAREQEVLRLLARGLRNKEIATRLVVSERTVNFHLANIYQKLNVSGRTEALSKALEQGLISA
jgi:DNA-binding NarL/FixJ family response regulator